MTTDPENRRKLDAFRERAKVMPGSRVARLARKGKDRSILRRLYQLRGEWQLFREEWELAAISLQEVVGMAREVGQSAPSAEAQLALAKFHLGRLTDPRPEAERLAGKNPSHLDLAHLWSAIGDQEEAKTHALAAYNWAWADGEPYVHRYYLNQS